MSHTCDGDVRVWYAYPMGRCGFDFGYRFRGSLMRLHRHVESGGEEVVTPLWSWWFSGRLIRQRAINFRFGWPYDTSNDCYADDSPAHPSGKPAVTESGDRAERPT